MGIGMKAGIAAALALAAGTASAQVKIEGDPKIAFVLYGVISDGGWTASQDRAKRAAFPAIAFSRLREKVPKADEGLFASCRGEPACPHPALSRTRERGTAGSRECGTETGRD